MASVRDRFQREAGVAKLLRDTASSPGVAYVVLEAQDGRVLAASDRRYRFAVPEGRRAEVAA